MLIWLQNMVPINLSHLGAFWWTRSVYGETSSLELYHGHLIRTTNVFGDMVQYPIA